MISLCLLWVGMFRVGLGFMWLLVLVVSVCGFVGDQVWFVCLVVWLLIASWLLFWICLGLFNSVVLILFFCWYLLLF